MAEENTVRVLRGAPYNPADAPIRTTAQQRVDDILTDVEAHLQTSRSDLAYALENMKILMVPQHQNVELLIGQLIEQVAEHKRMHR